MRKIFYVFALFLLFLGVFVFARRSLIGEIPEGAHAQSIVRIGDSVVIVEVARNYEARAGGLSGRGSLPENTGMLFVFEEPGNYSFWMKDMKFPIDIIWLDKNKKVVYITENAKPISYPERFQTPEPAQYVLEVNGGWAREHGIEAGNYAEFDVP